jgi:hypothetical protein
MWMRRLRSKRSSDEDIRRVCHAFSATKMSNEDAYEALERHRD